MRILDDGEKFGDINVGPRPPELPSNSTTVPWIDPLPDGSCHLGYEKIGNRCYFKECPKFSDFFNINGVLTCRCYYGYYAQDNECVEDLKKAPIVAQSTKLILAPSKTDLATPIGIILGIASAIALGILAAAIAARKCADGGCVPARKKTYEPVGTELPIERQDFIHEANNDEMFYRDSNQAETQDLLDFGYSKEGYGPVVTQSVNETMEMFEQSTGGGAGAAAAATGGLGGYTQNRHSSSYRDLAMDSFQYNQSSNEYELSNVTCVTMTPNGKYAIVGQSIGSPQIWDTTNGQLVRTMSGVSNNCSKLALACNGTMLVGLLNETSAESQASNVHLWEVQSGKPIQMTHQIKCHTFCQSGDTNSIFMAGNQRFGRGISVGVLDLVSNELAKEIKSDPNITFGDFPEAVMVTPDEKHAIVGCRSQGGTNFVVFDLTKTTEIAHTRSITLDADPKCMQVLNNSEVVTGTKSGHLIQWNIHSCKPTHTYVDGNEGRAHNSSINHMVLSEEKDLIATASNDGTAKVWNAINKDLVSVMSGHFGEVTCISMSHYPNNDLLITGSTDQTVGLWKLMSGQQVSSMNVGMGLMEVHMARHNKTIVAIGEKDTEQQLLLLRVINVQK